MKDKNKHMTPGVGAPSMRRDLYAQIAAITQDPAAQPLADALRHVSACLQAGEPLLASNACERLATVAPGAALPVAMGMGAQQPAPQARQNGKLQAVVPVGA